MTEPRGTFTEETFGRYRLLAPLGRGGMAEVFKAKSFGVEGFEKVLVIKRILPELAASKAFVDMFVHEAKLAVRLSHANIVQVFDLGRVDGPGDAPSYFMAMEYVAGVDLATVLRRCKKAGIPIPDGMAIFIAAEVAKGLDHAHRRRDDLNQPLGIVHRDVSPQNVLLSWEGEVKVTDFGIAKARDNLDERPDESNVRTVKGKHAYMSPEQARGEVVDARSDLFSLGTVLYETLAGVNPFRAPSAFETVRRVQAGELPPIELLRQDVPAPLAALVAKALAKRREDRFSDAGRMYEELLAWLYQSGARFGAGDLADFLEKLRGSADVGTDGPRAIERTPVEVPSSTANIRLSDAGVPPAAPSRPPAGATQRREVTALVVSLRAAVDGARPRALDVLERYGATVLAESAPLEIASLFGLRDADARDTEYAVRAATVLLRSLAQLGAGAAAGIHTGRLFATQDDAPVFDEHASALLSVAQELSRATDARVALSQAAARNVRGLFELTPLPRAPGAGPPALVAGEVRAPQETYGRFVGRRDELARLGRTLASATRRHLSVVALTGPQGIGKTRLLHEVDRRLRKGEYNVGFYLATCPPRGHDVPLSGVTAMLEVLCGVQEGDPPERVRALEPSLRALGLLEEEVWAVLAQLGDPDAEIEGVHALRSAFVKTLMRLSEDRVHVFAWDDAHSIDAASLALLGVAAKRLGGARVALLFAGRGESLVPSLSDLGEVEHVELSELAKSEAERLVALRAGARELPPELTSFVLDRAGGHPLFIEELVKDLADTGALSVTEGVASLALTGERGVPRPLRSIVAGRVARLPPKLLLALQLAAVAGEPTPRAVLASLLDGVDEALASLEERDLLRRAGASSWVFASPLLRDVVLDALPTDTRREMHGRVATALEGALGSKLDDQADRVAAQHLEAGRRDLAAPLFARAARRRLVAKQYDAAAEAALRALDLLDLSVQPLGPVLDVLRTLARAVDRLRVAPAAPGVLARVLAAFDERGTADERAAARMESAGIYAAISLYDDALAVLAAARREPLPLTTAQRARLIEAELQGRRGDFARAKEILEEARSLGLDRTLETRALILLTQAHGALGDREAALASLDQAALGPVDDSAAEAERWKLRGLIHYFARSFAESVEASAKSVELAKSQGLTFEVAIGLHNMGDSLVRLHDYPRAYAALSQSLAACEQCGAERLASQNRMYLGYLDAAKGVPGGETMLRSGIAHAEERGYAWDVVNGRYLLGLLLEQLGLVSAAASELARCRDQAVAIGNRLIADDCEQVLARCRPASSVPA